jgi:hypothetical protein
MRIDPVTVGRPLHKYKALLLFNRFCRLNLSKRAMERALLLGCSEQFRLLFCIRFFPLSLSPKE